MSTVAPTYFNIIKHEKKNLSYAHTAFVLSKYLEDAKIGENTSQPPVVYVLLEVAVYRPTQGEQQIV